MLVEDTNESTARLPQQFGRMDIKDLLTSKPSPRPNGDRRLSTFSQGTSPPNCPRPLQSAPDFPLPSTKTGHPILPSPAPTISYAPEYIYHRSSPPYHAKSEGSEFSQPAWDRHTPHPSYYSNYQGYDHSAHYSTPPVSVYSPNKRALSLDEQSSKRQKKGKGPNQKWDAEEDARIIELRGNGMKWGDISKNLPGRTEIACRLHYQNYLEKRGQWDEEKKTKLARVYDRMKAELWQPLANELGVPWRAAEAMHWLLGEREMARRANTVPFAMVSGANSAGPQGEGNGRIAQTNRMHDSTIYFEPSDVAALHATHHQDRSGPVSMFAQNDTVHAGSNGGSGSPGSDQHITEGGGIGDDEDRGNRSLGEESHLGRRLSTKDDFVKREELTSTNEEEGWRLPGLADLDSGISAYVGHGSKGDQRQGSCQTHGSRRGSSTRDHRDSNGSGHGSHRNSNGGSHHSPNGHHHPSPREIRTEKAPSRRGSGHNSDTSTSSGGSNGYVQVPAQTGARKGSASGGDENA